MDTHTLGILIDMIGTALIGIVAMRVHHTVLKDKAIDENVVRVMKIEQRFMVLGIIMVCLGKYMTMLA